MHHVVSATTNPAKIQAILRAFEEIFGEGSCHIDAIGVESVFRKSRLAARKHALAHEIAWQMQSRRARR